MRKTSRAEKICTVCEKIGDIGDSVKGSSSPMKNKVGAQKGAFIKMKQENMYIYQWVYGVCYVPIIAPSFSDNYFTFRYTTFSSCAVFEKLRPIIVSICAFVLSYGQLINERIVDRYGKPLSHRHV